MINNHCWLDLSFYIFSWDFVAIRRHNNRLDWFACQRMPSNNRCYSTTSFFLLIKDIGRWHFCKRIHLLSMHLTRKRIFGKQNIQLPPSKILLHLLLYLCWNHLWKKSGWIFLRKTRLNWIKYPDLICYYALMLRW